MKNVTITTEPDPICPEAKVSMVRLWEIADNGQFAELLYTVTAYEGSLEHGPLSTAQTIAINFDCPVQDLRDKG